MVGNTGVQLFRTEGNGFAEQRKHLLGAQAEGSERLNVGRQMGAAVTNNNGVDLTTGATKHVRRIALHDFAWFNMVFFRRVREPVVTSVRREVHAPAFFIQSSNERSILAVLQVAGCNEEAVVR